MDHLYPEYNVLKTTYSSLGYKYTEKTLVKIRSSLEKLNLGKSVKVVVTNLETNVSNEYTSLREAAKCLNTNKTILKNYIFQNMPYKGIYTFKFNFSISNFDSNYLNHPAPSSTTNKIEAIYLELNTVTNYASIRAALLLEI